MLGNIFTLLARSETISPATFAPKPNSLIECFEIDVFPANDSAILSFRYVRCVAIFFQIRCLAVAAKTQILAIHRICGQRTPKYLTNYLLQAPGSSHLRHQRFILVSITSQLFEYHVVTK